MNYEMPLERLRAAELVVRRYFPPTPVLPAPRLGAALGATVDCKLDTATPIRVFKLRGALVKLDALSRAGVGGGVATASAGNHGLAVARAARLAGRSALVCVPAAANPQKVALIEAEGARVEQRGHDYQAAFERCLELAQAEGRTVVHAYDDPDVISGQGSVGLELLAGGEYDAVLMGIGGGGLISGVAAAVKQLRPATRVIGLQPEGANSMVQSLAAGQPTAIERVATIADGLGARRPGEWTFALTQRYVDDVWTVSDAQILEAMAFLLREERQIVEPAGGAAVAGLLARGAAAAAPQVAGRAPRLAVVLSGANIADALLADVLARV